jgi:2-polyprenyl-3-methyl-5-hydroxy-6-metoxy-1,4-benzoquinol methylase
MGKCIVYGDTNQFYIYKKLLTKCTTCSFVTVNLHIEDEKIREIYSEKYFKGEEYEDYIRDKEIFQNNFSRRINLLEKYIPYDKRRNILEIGCAYGFLGELITKRWHCNYLGIDIVKDAIEYASQKLKLNVLKGDYLETNNTQFKFDTFIMLDVLEHLSDPDAILNKITKEISNGGYVVISTGDIGSILANIQGNRWRMIHPPSHLHYFNKKSIRALLKKYGFEVVNISYPGIKRSLRQVFFSLFILKKKRLTILNNIYELLPETWSVSINTFDVMLVTAKKVL